MQLTLEIPDNKFSFFMELICYLGFAKVLEINEHELMLHQIELLEIEIQKLKGNPDYMFNWEDKEKAGI